MNKSDDKADGKQDSCSSASSDVLEADPGTPLPELQHTQFSVDDDVIKKLASGVVGRCQPDLVKSKKHLSDITDSQKILIETVQQENAKFVECQAIEEVTRTMEQAKQYHAKLINIKKEMSLLHEKTGQLKRRALKLQQQKQTEALMAEQRRERELERERALTARDVTGRRKPAAATPR